MQAKPFSVFLFFFVPSWKHDGCYSNQGGRLENESIEKYSEGHRRPKITYSSSFGTCSTKCLERVDHNENRATDDVARMWFPPSSPGGLDNREEDGKVDEKKSNLRPSLSFDPLGVIVPVQPASLSLHIGNKNKKKNANVAIVNAVEAGISNKKSSWN